jgi:nucleotidyltransferase/DNA polymerase involved in DNA repair
MDAFYASVELLRYPQLKGLPVVIRGGRRKEDDVLARLREVHPDYEWSADNLSEIPLDFFPRIEGYTGRGVITTATYAARQFGIGSAMGLMKAAQLCPQAILLPVDFEQYRYYSRQFKGLITEIAPLMEDRGVDEVYIDFTEVPGGQREGGRVLARLKVTRHPLYPWFDDATALAHARTEAGQATLAHFFARRENAIRDAQADPFHCEPDLPHCLDAGRSLDRVG